MAKLSKDAERAIKQAEQVVEETIDRTGDAIEHYADTMQKAFSSFQFSSKELTDKMQSFTQANIEAAQKFVQKLSQAKDFQDVIRIQTEYIQRRRSSSAFRSSSDMAIFRVLFCDRVLYISREDAILPKSRCQASQLALEQSGNNPQEYETTPNR